jgi:hypothetical protein
MKSRGIKRLVIERLVTEKIMGWKWLRPGCAFIEDVRKIKYFNPTLSIADAWQVVEKLRERRIFSLCDAWDEDDKPIFYANFQYNDGCHVVNYDAYAKTAPLAICLAALKSVGVEVEVNEQ